MGKYNVTYVKDTFNTKERKRFFEVKFQSKSSSEQFSLYPDLIKNNKDMEGFAANPASKHYWYKDIFVYISSFQENNKADTTSFQKKEIGVGDTTYYSNGFLVLHKVDKNPAELQSKYAEDEQAVFLDIEVFSKEGKRYKATPGIALKGAELRSITDTVISQSMVIAFNKVPTDANGKFEIGVKESAGITDLITLKVYEFPMINLLWIGIVITVIGFGMAVVQRVKAR
jgi:cytochrome c-type biogenesis protein CcmF